MNNINHYKVCYLFLSALLKKVRHVIIDQYSCYKATDNNCFCTIPVCFVGHVNFEIYWPFVLSGSVIV